MKMNMKMKMLAPSRGMCAGRPRRFVNRMLTMRKVMPTLRGVPSRDEQIAALAAEEFDVVIVGAGATGSGCALDAATRGLRVACVERGDFGCETSSRSTKLIWAGIRYLGTATANLLRWHNLIRPREALKDFWGEFQMVRGAHRERHFLLNTQPHLTNWIPIMVPVDRWIMEKPMFGHPVMSIAPLLLPIVFKVYDALSGFTCPSSYAMSARRAKEIFPQLDQDIKYAQVFYEGQHDDARTNVSIAMTAAEHGARIANYVEVSRILTDGEGKACGVVAKDDISGRRIEIKAKAVVFCGGPFTDELRSLEKDGDDSRAVAAGGGSHIVLPGYFSPPSMGLLDMNTSDGRFLFFLPWLGHTVVGTTDSVLPTAVSSPEAPEDEVQWILNEAAKYLSDDLQVRRSDVMSSWRGFRPLARDPHALPGAPVSRDHIISVNPTTGVTFIAGGKWTTYREMAEDLVDRVVEDHELEAGPCVTLETKLIGAAGFSENLNIQLIQKYSVDEATASHLAVAYGDRAWDVCELAQPTGKEWPRYGVHIAEGYPYIDAEVRYACREYVRHVKDFIAFRSRLAFLNTFAAGQAIERVSEIMAEELKWDERTRMQEVKMARAFLSDFGGPVPDKHGAVLRQATMADLHSVFTAIDTDKSGYLDATEVRQASQALGFELSGNKLHTAFAAMDINGDGKISLEEFEQWWNSYDARLSIDGKPNRDRLLQVFRHQSGSWTDSSAVSDQQWKEITKTLTDVKLEDKRQWEER